LTAAVTNYRDGEIGQNVEMLYRCPATVNKREVAKGWMRVPSGGDTAVAAVGKVSEQDTLQTFTTAFLAGDGRMAWHRARRPQRRSLRKFGNLTVDIFDGSTERLVWRGEAANILSSKPEKNEHKLETSIQKMLDHFPPASKG
jgi:hypothetical protein